MIRRFFAGGILLIAVDIIGYSQASESINDCQKNTRRYQQEEGSLTYIIYNVSRKGKKLKKLFTATVDYKEYGRVQRVIFKDQDSVSNLRIYESECFVQGDERFLLNYFVLDTCSSFYRGIQVIKPLEAKYKGQKCIRYIQYRFDDCNGNPNMGSVTYCSGLPVYIRGGSNQTFIWELQ